MQPKDVPFTSVDTTKNPHYFVQMLDRIAADTQIQQIKQQSYILLGIQPGQTLLDMGCGTGDDVRNLATLVGTAGTVVGVDSSATMIATARQRSAGAALPGTFQQVDSTHLPFADATFDGARSERVFQHLPDRRAALAEMARVTKAGGRVVVTDADHGMTAVTASDRVLTRRVLDFLTDDGQNGWCGRELPGLFHQVGLTEITVVPNVLQMNDFPSFDAMCGLPANLKYAQTHGIFSAAEIATWRADLTAFDARGEFFAAIVVFSVVGRRP